MNERWSQEKYYKAFMFAAKAHNGQRMPGSDLPYITHVALVCSELMLVLDRENEIDADFMLQCGALHDVIEDTEISYEDVVSEFGHAIAEGVMALSKDPGIEKSRQIEESLNRITEQPTEVWMVKLADRITNLNPPPVNWSKEKKKNYLKQSEVIDKILGPANDFLKRRLQDKINEYSNYF